MDAPPFFLYWGKAKPDTGTTPLHLLPCHCLDVAAVGVEYLRRSESLKTWFKERLQLDDDEALCGWISFWFALHDLGKFSEAFQSQREDLFQTLRGRKPQPEKVYGERHDSLGMRFWRGELLRHLQEENCFDDDWDRADGLDAWARAVTGHHGQPPHEDGKDWTFYFHKDEDRVAILGFVSELRRLFLDGAAAKVPMRQDGDAFRLASLELSWWVAGLAVLADWVGSNAEAFPYCTKPPASLEAYWARAREQAARALDRCGVLRVPSEPSRGFEVLFPSIAQPSPLQAWASSVAIEAGPQIHLLEDVTGAGKTEAAVMLVHRMMAAGAADGFFIGLPTMATANAMYGRIAGVYARLFGDEASLMLAHGKDRLVEDFAASILAPGREERDARQADDTATARCAAWLADHRKRALLAPAGVGTIDQALLGALQSRHQSLRLLGLFRKVLVVDEVHACDAYMQVVLEALLRLHARGGGSAVLLSATLPQRMKQSLLAAFADGCGERARLPVVERQDYPLVSSWRLASPGQLDECPVATREDVRRRVAVRYESDRDAVVAAIEAALAAGRCAMWIRNTVADALDAHRLFATRVAPGRLTLFHARFALGDRLAIERQVLAHFGRDSTPEQRRGRLLIATQVAEQSLDIDVDLLVSDLAPIDRLIQRAGRLQRHVRAVDGARLTEPDARDARDAPCLWVFGPAWSEVPDAGWFKRAFPKAAGVYPHHGQLWLTARALQAGSIAMPDDARRLIEGVFGNEAEVPQGLRGNANKAEGKEYGDAALAQQNCVNLSRGYARGGTDWLDDAKTPSRLGEDTVEVLLARWEGARLVPWFEHENLRHAWAYSGLKVAARLIAREAEPATAARRAALEEARVELPGQGKWSVLLPLEEVGGRWIGWAEGAGEAARRRGWQYDACFGLAPAEEEAPDEGSPGA